MWSWAFVFFIAAVVAELLGFAGLATSAISIGKLLLLAALMLGAHSALGGLVRSSHRAPIGRG